MNIIKSILTNNDCYKSNRKINVKGIMLHSVGVNQPDATVFINSWNRAGLEKCVHGFIDTKNIYQTLPWNHRAWHCGDSGNNTHIGIEMTEPAHIKYIGGNKYSDSNPSVTLSHIMSCYDKAVDLFAYLCEEYNLNPLEKGVIVSHREGNKLGIASNHGDPEHIWTNHNLTMDKFRSDIHAKMNGNSPSSGTSNSFLVKVTADALNIRKSHNASSPIMGVIKDKGTYTIVSTYNGWGRLKSGAGWINLSYTKRI